MITPDGGTPRGEGGAEGVQCGQWQVNLGEQGCWGQFVIGRGER